MYELLAENDAGMTQEQLAKEQKKIFREAQERAMRM